MQLINVKCIILVDLIISRNISIPLNQDWCVFSSSGFQLGWNISIGWCFATREKVAVTPERISNALQQVKCEAPLKHPVASLCPLQCCCGAAVASRALAGWAGPRMSLFVACGTISQAEEGYCESSHMALVNKHEPDTFPCCHSSSFQQQISFTRQCIVCCFSSLLVLSGFLASLCLHCCSCTSSPLTAS